MSIALPAFTRTVFKNIPLPYTVLLLLLGSLFGLLSSNVDAVAQYTTIVSINPHVILHVFLPVLIFESAFAMDVHTFVKSGAQILLMAIPGLSKSVFPQLSDKAPTKH